MTPSPGTVVWITGLPRSGKTTVAEALCRALRSRRVPVLWLDSDDLREVMTPHPSYSDAERDALYGTLGRVAQRAAEGGVLTVISATAAYRRYRDAVRAAVPRFVEVWLQCSEAERRSRDPDGLYAAAEAGRITRLPGVNAPYEPPAAAELALDTSARSPDAALDVVMRWLDAHVLAASP